MRHLRLWLMLLPVAVVLAGCQLGLQVTLFNNTGEAIAVDETGDTVSIAKSRSVRFRYPRERANRVFRLIAGNCKYLYDVPHLPVGYGAPLIPTSSDRGAQMQVEKDYSIHLLPSDYAGDQPAPTTAFLQREGFPLQPVSRKCR